MTISRASPANLGERVEEASWVRKAVVLTLVKALIWAFAASTLGPKQSDKVMDLCYSLEQCVKGEESQQEEEEHRTEGVAVLTYCAAVVLRLC